MFESKNNPNEIKVEFFEGDNSQPFAVSNIAVDDLPDTFEIQTTINLADQDWRVLNASPPKKSEFIKSGNLKLSLVKVEILDIDPNTVLFSLPTINDDIAAVKEAKISLEDALIVLEDDWRQFEFISNSFNSSIDEEMKAIKSIYENHREGIGFNQIHVRKIIKEPLRDKFLHFDRIKHLFSIKRTFSGVAFNNIAAAIVNGFALETQSGWLLWGQVDVSGNIIALNLREAENANVDEIEPEIESFMSENCLYLVNWPSLFWCGSAKSDFAEYRDYLFAS